MNENCPVCALDFDRGDPGYFTGAMYASYAMAIPLIALVTLILYLFLPPWSLLRLVSLASLICSPLIPWIWQYSRVLWIYFDRYFDPEEEPGGTAIACPASVEECTFIAGGSRPSCGRSFGSFEAPWQSHGPFGAA